MTEWAQFCGIVAPVAGVVAASWYMTKSYPRNACDSVMGQLTRDRLDAVLAGSSEVSGPAMRQA